MEPAIEQSPVSSSHDTVTVGCKLPSGIVLHLDDMIDYRIPMPGGGSITEKRSRRRPDTFTLNGSAIDLAKIASTGSVPHLVIGGYGITSGIPRDFWERWFAANEQTEIVLKKIVYAESNEMRARSFAAEHVEIRTGMEPINPDEPGRFSTEARKIQRGTTSAG